MNDAFLQSERIAAKVDRTGDPLDGMDRQWAKGPRVLLCDCPTGTRVRTIDGAILVIVRRTELFVELRRDDGEHTCLMIPHAAVLAIGGHMANP